MRDHSAHIELTRDEAVATILEQAHDAIMRARATIESVPLCEAYGRVLACDVKATIPIPTCLTCKMDSVALRWNDIKDLAEGELPDTSTWVRGVQWQFANTGVAMPEGFDTALRIEEVVVADDEQSITFLDIPREQYAGTKAAGSGFTPGQVIAEAGTEITPPLAARIAGGNNATVKVVRKPRVAFIATGNELTPAGCPPLPAKPGLLAAYGKTIESNSILVRGLVEQWGGEYVPFDIIPDDYDTIKETVLEAVKLADIVLLNGGSSKGSDDWCVEVLEEVGTVVCHQMSHGPAHHSSLATVKNTPVVGVSGPPGGAEFALRFYLQPLMRAMLSLDPAPLTLKVRYAEEFKRGHYAKMGTQPGNASSTGAGEDTGEGAAAAANPTTTEPVMKEYKVINEGFRAIKPALVTLAEDGVLEVRPAGRAGSEQALNANALCLLPDNPAAAGLHVGGLIEVELKR